MKGMTHILLGVLALSLSTASLAQNMAQNPGFESGTDSWSVWGSASLNQTSDQPHNGSFSAVVGNRTQTWEAVAQNMQGQLASGTTYQFSAWVRVAGDAQQTVNLSYVQTDNDGEVYSNVASSASVGNQWVKLSGAFTYISSGPVTRLEIFVDGPVSGVDFYVDDVDFRVVTDDWKEAANARIDLLRKRDVTVTVTDLNGNVVEGA